MRPYPEGRFVSTTASPTNSDSPSMNCHSRFNRSFVSTYVLTRYWPGGSDGFEALHCLARSESLTAMSTRLCCQSLALPHTARSEVAIGSASQELLAAFNAWTFTCTNRSSHSGGVSVILNQMSVANVAFR